MLERMYLVPDGQTGSGGEGVRQLQRRHSWNQCSKVDRSMDKDSQPQATPYSTQGEPTISKQKEYP